MSMSDDKKGHLQKRGAGASCPRKNPSIPTILGQKGGQDAPPPLFRKWLRKRAEATDRPVGATGSPQEGHCPTTGGLRRALKLVALVAAVLSIAGGVWFRGLLEGPVARGEFEAAVVVTRGMPYSAILGRLQTAGLLPHPFVFDYLAWRRGDAGRLRPGRYVFHSSMSVRQIYDRLLRGAPIRVTVPEGWTLGQIAARLVEVGLVEDAAAFTSAACDAQLLEPHAIAAESAEGYVLPDTYLFDPGVTSAEILETMVEAFGRQSQAERDTSPPLALTWHEVLTLASMIEREARREEEKPRIASVYYNRLRRGMKLDCDATVRFAVSKTSAPLTRSDLEVDSPYNTYLYPGLPPGPICCVGRESIHAVLAPEETDFLYYCYRGDGTHHFSRSLVEHEEAVKKYLRKRLTPEPAKQ